MALIISIFGDNKLLIEYGLFVALFVTAGHLLAILGSRKLEAW